MRYNLKNDWNHLSDMIKWLNIQLSDYIKLLSDLESWMIFHENEQNQTSYYQWIMIILKYDLTNYQESLK